MGRRPSCGAAEWMLLAHANAAGDGRRGSTRSGFRAHANLLRCVLREYDNFAVDTTINTQGTVAFRGEVLADGDEGLWSGNGGPLTTHYLVDGGGDSAGQGDTRSDRPWAG